MPPRKEGASLVVRSRGYISLASSPTITAQASAASLSETVSCPLFAVELTMLSEEPATSTGAGAATDDPSRSNFEVAAAPEPHTTPITAANVIDLRRVTNLRSLWTRVRLAKNWYLHRGVGLWRDLMNSMRRWRGRRRGRRLRLYPALRFLFLSLSIFPPPLLISPLPLVAP